MGHELIPRYRLGGYYHAGETIEFPIDPDYNLPIHINNYKFMCVERDGESVWLDVTQNTESKRIYPPLILSRDGTYREKYMRVSNINWRDVTRLSPLVFEHRVQCDIHCHTCGERGRYYTMGESIERFLPSVLEVQMLEAIHHIECENCIKSEKDSDSLKSIENLIDLAKMLSYVICDHAGPEYVYSEDNIDGDVISCSIGENVLLMLAPEEECGGYNLVVRTNGLTFYVPIPCVETALSEEKKYYIAIGKIASMYLKENIKK